MYLNTLDKTECAGCTACAGICPKHAIEMETDQWGFAYPMVQESLCVHCGLCERACDFYKEREHVSRVIAAYGVKHKSLSARKRSRSGGAFMALAQVMIRDGGVCWGAAFDENLDVVHCCITEESSLSRLQGSKYVQSDLGREGDCFRKVAEQLQQGLKVLFSGTACQIAGLLTFLETKKCTTENLLTCDIVCQGVPSPQLFREYRAYLERKYKDKLKDFNFRDKSRIGWSGHEESFSFVHKKSRVFSRRYVNYYYYYYMRYSCFSCKYTGLNRPADITLADFWGAQENYPAFADTVGNSLVLVNTQKGEAAFHRIQPDVDWIEADIQHCMQPRLMSPSKKPEHYETFWQEYQEKGSTYCIEKYGKESLKSKLVYTVKPFLRKVGVMK